MDVAVIIERNDANPFTLIINGFDTVPEIKMKIHKITGIPISRQTLIFQGQILTDDFDILRSNIDFKSRIQLIVNNDFPPPATPPAATNHPPAAEDHPVLTAENARLYGLDTEFKIMTEDLWYPLPAPLEFVTTTTGRNDLPPPPPTPTPSAADGSNQNPNSKWQRVVEGRSNLPYEEPVMRVVVDFRGVRTPVEVMRDDTVASLREKLEEMAVNVPEGPYFFVHGQNTMEDDRSYRWHRVAQGDDILLFPGYVERR